MHFVSMITKVLSYCMYIDSIHTQSISTGEYFPVVSNSCVFVKLNHIYKIRAHARGGQHQGIDLN